MASIRDDTIDRAKSVCHNEISELFDVWEETGVGLDKINTYADQVLNHLIGLMKDMVNEAIQKKKDLLTSIKVLANSARKLSRELSVEFAADSHDDLPLTDLKRTLKEMVGKLEQMKDDRLRLVKELLVKESEICAKLGLEPSNFISDIPTEQEIQQFENNLRLRELEEMRLSEIFEASRESIIKMMEELLKSPTLDFERMICTDPDKFVYSSNNMDRLKHLQERLKTEVDEAKVQAQEKRDNLISLWNYIDEPMMFRENFLKKNSGYNSVVIKALDVEIKRCKEKRSQNIANYVEKVRNEITSLWELCKYGEPQKKSFAAMKCQTYTEDLLLLHESEVEKLRRYYNCNKKIFDLLNEWEVHFEKLKELSFRANDPDRYHNRGGQLLMEEKERKASEKKIPRLENQLYTLVDEFESTNRECFLIHGLSLREYINHNREKYEIEKENMKIARKQAKDKSAKKTPLSTSKRTPGMMNVPRTTPASNRIRSPTNKTMLHASSAAKRKLPFEATNNTTQVKKRIISPGKNKSTVVSTRARRSGRTPGRIANTSGRMKTGINKRNRRTKNDTLLSVSSYGNFQNHLDDRDELRSSILASNRQDRDGDEMMLMKTPIKPVRRRALANSTPLRPTPTRLGRLTPRDRKIRTPQQMTTHLSPIELDD